MLQLLVVLAQYHAIQVDEKTAPGLYGTVKKLVNRAKLPMPKVYVIKSNVPNAFATGRNPEHAAVAVNTALAEMLTQEELEGVLAHELTHVKNRDILISTNPKTPPKSALHNYHFFCQNTTPFRPWNKASKTTTK